MVTRALSTVSELVLHLLIAIGVRVTLIPRPVSANAHLATAAWRFAIRPTKPGYLNHLSRSDLWSARAAVLLELFHHPLKIPLARRGVDGGGLQPLMTQQRSHTHQVSPRIEGVLAEAVAEGMGSHVLEPSQ